MDTDTLQRWAVALLVGVVAGNSLRPEPPLAKVIQDLGVAHKCMRQVKPPLGDEFVAALLGHAVASANADAARSGASFLGPPGDCCAICLREWSGLDREEVMPSSFARQLCAHPGPLARHCVYACDACLKFGRKWEATFFSNSARFTQQS